MNDSRSSARVLIIDDEEVISQSFCFQLEDLGYEVVSASNGRVGIELIEQHAPDVVLTDLRMPEMDGLAVIRHMKQQEIATPVIVISGAGRISDAVEALRIGADDYLIKPVSDLVMLHHAVEKALQKARLIRENKTYQQHLEQLVRDRTKELEHANLNMRIFNQRLRAVVETSIGMSGCLSVQDFCDQILLDYAKNLDAASGCLYQISDQGLHLCHELEEGFSVPFIAFPLATGSFLQQVMISGQSLLVTGASQVEFLKPEHQKLIRDQTLLFFPVIGVHGLAVGLLAMYRKKEGLFDQQDKEIGTLLASYGNETLRAVNAFESLRVSDQRYRMLFDKTNDAIFLASRTTGLFIDANDAASRLTGRSVDELKQTRTREIVQENITPPLRKLDESNSVQDLGMVHFVRKNRALRTTRLNVILIDSETVVGIARDITDEQMMETQLRRVQKLDAIGQLTGGIAHDFNNILGIILGNINLLKRQVQHDDAVLKRVETIQKSSERAATLTKQLLGFSRKQAAETKVTDINRAIGGMKNLIARSVTPEIEISYKVAENLWLTDIDPGDFEGALLNLAINARDAMSGRGRLLLETSNQTIDRHFSVQDGSMPHSGIEPGEYVVLSVSDTGEGITPDIQERIFEPFFTTKPQGKGTGLGLAMVFGFVERSKGYIKVESKSGCGSTFNLYFPRTAGAEQSIPLVDSTAGRMPKGSETILVVDDEAELLAVAAQSLQGLGYRVLTAENAQQALRQLDKEPDISLLFSDVVMPGGMNGYELADQAVQGKPGLKVLLSSGYTGSVADDDRFYRFRENMLTKPYTLSTLAQTLRKLLGELTAAIGDESDNSSDDAEPAWNESICIGIRAVDDDHAKLMSLFNQCRLQASEDPAHEKSGQLLDQLIDYTTEHFRREERIMEVCGYPGLSNHRQVHLMLERQLKRRIRRSRLGDDWQSDMKLFEFLADWLNDHIRSMDVAMASYCKGKEDLIERALGENK